MNEQREALSVDEARGRIIELCAGRRLEPQRVRLEEAHGRILADDFHAPANLPAFANSAMDGFALRGAELPLRGEARFRIVGTRLAGDSAEVSMGAGECLRIMTGALMPGGADTVVIKERARIDLDSIVVGAGEIAGSNVRQAGEDFRTGERVAARGERLGCAHLAVLASLGRVVVDVARRPRLAVITTGDELVMPGEDCAPAQIYNSNGHSLAALARISGAELVSTDSSHAREPFQHLADDRKAIGGALQAAAHRVDVIVTSGGVSAGEADFLPELIKQAGRVHFWKVRMRPGMPFLCGEIDRTLVFCLPGNPVSSIATFLGFVRPALAALQGSNEVAPREHQARLAAPFSKRHQRTEFLRARSEVRADASVWVTPLARQGSSMLRGVMQANCLIVVPEATSELEAGELVRIMPLPEGF